MNKFELIAGRYYDRQNRLYEKGDVVISSADMVRSFANKFKLIGPATPEEVAKFQASTGKRKVAPAPVKPAVDQPEDRTKDFPEAADTTLVVQKLGNNYSVIDPDAPGKPLNKKPLTKDGVTRFLREYLDNDAD